MYYVTMLSIFSALIGWLFWLCTKIKWENGHTIGFLARLMLASLFLSFIPIVREAIPGIYFFGLGILWNPKVTQAFLCWLFLAITTLLYVVRVNHGVVVTFRAKSINFFLLCAYPFLVICLIVNLFSGRF